MQLSSDGCYAITQREGVRLQVYPDSAGYPTIGIGHLITPKEKAAQTFLHGITLEEATALFRRDVQWAVKDINALVVVPLKQAQFDALCSFVFNVGYDHFLGSTLLRDLNRNMVSAVPEQMKRWVYAGKVLQPGLVRRRLSEAQQWESAS